MAYETKHLCDNCNQVIPDDNFYYTFGVAHSDAIAGYNLTKNLVTGDYCTKTCVDEAAQGSLAAANTRLTRQRKQRKGGWFG